MKTKLLNKVRRRFEITLYPKGYLWEGDVFYAKDGCVRFIDKENRFNNYNYSLSGLNEQTAVDYAKRRLLSIVREDYAKKIKQKDLPAIKLWYNG